MLTIRRIAPVLAVALALGLLATDAGCSFCTRITDAIDFFKRKFVNVEDILNRAIADVNANSQNWQRILQKAIDDLGPAERQVRQDLNDLLQRGIETAGLEVRCDISYLRDMLVEGLQRILARVKNQPPPPLTAVVCDALPAAIDMNLPPNNRNSVEVFGYNLDQPGLTLSHVTGGGALDATPYFTVTSPFKRVINLGANGVALTPSSVKLSLNLLNGGMRDIPVIQKWPEVCATRTVNTTTQQIQVIPARVGGGDTEFAGHGPCIRATARAFASPDGRHLGAELNVDAWECPDDLSKAQKDYTEGIGLERRILFTTDQDEKIVEVRSPTTALLEYIDQDNDPNEKPDSGLVQNWIIVGDTDGDDLGKTSVTASFAPAVLVLQKTGDCVTEEELARLMNQRMLSATVVEHLKAVRPGVAERARTLGTDLRRRIR